MTKIEDNSKSDKKTISNHRIDQDGLDTIYSIPEIEIKFPIADSQFDYLKSKINSFEGVINEGRMYERTSNFDNTDRLMFNQDARLRVREIGHEREDRNKRIEFCFKKRISVDGIKIEEETQSEFTTDPKNFILILNKIGYEYYNGYERYRETYKYLGTKITFDEFPFGYLLEIEGEVSDIYKVMEIIGMKKEDSYSLSCDDFYSYLCNLNGIIPKNTISFDDLDMPKYSKIIK